MIPASQLTLEQIAAAKPCRDCKRPLISRFKACKACRKKDRSYYRSKPRPEPTGTCSTCTTPVCAVPLERLTQVTWRCPKCLTTTLGRQLRKATPPALRNFRPFTARRKSDT
jgi:hypothetical protein